MVNKVNRKSRPKSEDDIFQLLNAMVSSSRSITLKIHGTLMNPFSKDVHISMHKISLNTVIGPIRGPQRISKRQIASFFKYGY